MAAAVTALSFVFAATAGAITLNGVAISHYANGFTVSAQGLGPIGIALDNQNRLFVTDSPDGFLYRFNAPFGTASPSTRLGGAPVSSNTGGLAFDDTGHLYLARFAENQVVEIDPNTGAIVRTVANLACPNGIAYDRLSGSLFVTTCNDAVSRIADAQSSSPHVSKYASITDPDGIAVGPDGNLYAVERGGVVARINGLSAVSPGHLTALANVPRADGISVGNGFLIVNRTNGKVTRLDLGTGAQVDLISQATRGDFSAVGADGCLYATQTNFIMKVTEPDGTCESLGGAGGLMPTTPSKSPKGRDLPSKKGCIDRRHFKFKLHHGPRSTVVKVTVFVNGKRKARKTGKNIKTVTLRRLPKKKFRVRVVSVHSNGQLLVSVRTYKGCKKSKPHTRRGHRHKK